MSQVLTAGSVEFSGFYYPEILRELLTDLRRNRDAIGLTDENDFEVHTQLLRAFALVGHLNNCRLDAVASELLIGSSSLLESLKRLLRLIGVELASASPAAVEVLLKVTEIYSTSVADFIPELSEFSTESLPPIPFEDLNGLDLTRNDRLSHAYGLEQEKAGTGYVDAASVDSFFRDSGDTFASGNVGDHIFITSGVAAGEYRITEWLNADSVRVVKIPGSTNPTFQTETGLNWILMAFTADGAASLNANGPTFTPWTDAEAGDMLYVGHDNVLFSQLDIELGGTVGDDIVGVWEYFDDSHSKFTPTHVNDYGSIIAFSINTLLGTADRRGAIVTVEHVATGIKENCLSIFPAGANIIVTTSTLGQTTVSTTLTDYTITAEWIPLENQDDQSDDFAQDGVVGYNFPQDEDRNWQETDVNLESGIWARYRVVSVGGTPVAPAIDRVKIDQGDQYVVRTCTQGETVGPQFVGSSDGSPSQEFDLPDTPFLDATEVIEVDEAGTGTWVQYTRSENFLDSTATSRHYIRESDAEDTAQIRFGDGENGYIPPVGSDNIRATYRIGGDVSGNVGVGEVSVNSDGVNGIGEVYNPRVAAGWRMKDGGTDEDIERLKRDAPAALRTRSTAVTPDDCARLATYEFTSSAGIKPVARAFAEEEGYGPKTVKLLVVGESGRTLSAAEKAELDEYFNGDRYASPPTSGVLMLNHELTTVNFEPLVVYVRATVVWPGGNSEAVKVALLNLLTPLALEDDGITRVWDFSGYVSLSRIYSEIHEVDPNVEDVAVLELSTDGSTWVTSNIRLGDNQLPTTTATQLIVNVQQTA